MSCRVELDAVVGAYADGDVAALRALYADDALICSAAAPDSVLGRDEMFSREDVLHRTRLIGAINLIPIDESAGLIQATVRTEQPDGLYKSADRVWLLTFKGGLIHRQVVLTSEQEAFDLYENHGVGLGIDSPD